MEEDRIGLELTIPYPSVEIRKRGIHATTRMGTQAKVRLNSFELRDIDIAARACSMTRASFMRWCAIWCAKKVMEVNAATTTTTTTTGSGTSGGT